MNTHKVGITGVSENCLYLSIWTRNLSPDNLTSVMVIMLSGREDMTEITGVELADVGDVVVVTVESRHGSLGYLASQDGQGIILETEKVFD